MTFVKTWHSQKLAHTTFLIKLKFLDAVLEVHHIPGQVKENIAYTTLETTQDHCTGDIHNFHRLRNSNVSVWSQYILPDTNNLAQVTRLDNFSYAIKKNIYIYIQPYYLFLTYYFRIECQIVMDCSQLYKI